MKVVIDILSKQGVARAFLRCQKCGASVVIQNRDLIHPEGKCIFVGKSFEMPQFLELKAL